MIKVSIIIPIYNVEKYIERCIHSIMDQTYPNIECILVNDCTQDRSIIIVQKMLEYYTGSVQFILKEHEENRGLSAARNTGTHYATGEYIYYLDSDDEITPSCISILIDFVLKYPGIDCVQGNTKLIPPVNKDQDWRNISYKNFPEYINDNGWIREHFYSNRVKLIPVNAWNKLVNRLFLINNLLFFEEGIIHEDELWMFFVVKKMKSIAFSTAYTYIHYQTEGSIMHSMNLTKGLKSWHIILYKSFSNIDPPYKDQQKRRYTALLFEKTLLLNKEFKHSELFKRYRHLIKKRIKEELKEFNIIYVLLLGVLLLPTSMINYLFFFLAKINRFIKNFYLHTK